MCLGKGLTGGYLPMAATLASDEIWNAFLGEYTESRHFFHGHTYSGNALSAAVSLASLRLFDDESVLENVQQRASQLGSRLADLRGRPIVGDVRQVGLIGAVELSLDRDLKIPFPWTERKGQMVCDFARSRGVFLRPLGSIVVIMPPLCITEEQLEQIMDAVDAGIELRQRLTDRRRAFEWTWFPTKQPRCTNATGVAVNRSKSQRTISRLAD